MSTYLYISKKCPYCDKLMKGIGSEEIMNHIEVLNVDVQKPIPEHKISHVPTIVFGNETIVGTAINKWFKSYKKDIGGEDSFLEGSDVIDAADPFGETTNEGDPFESFGDIKPKISDEMQKRINMSVNEAYESMNVNR